MGQPIYLDNAATSYPKPESVYRAIEAFVRQAGANPGRGGHRRAVEAEAMINDTRRLVARLLGCPRPERVVFAHNATDALNMAIKGVLRPGDHVLSSVLEHNSINRPLNRLEAEGRITLTRLPATADHLIDPDAVARAFTARTRLLAMTHASNVTGTIQPVAALGRKARERGALLLVDAAQSAGAVPIDVEKDCIDLLAFTGHKGLLGPTGTGGLVVGERAEIDSWRDGGTGGDSTSPLQPAEYPHRLEGGTPNVFGIAGLREGVRILLERGVETVLAHERELLAIFHAALRDPARFTWYGADRALAARGAEGRVGLVGLNVPGFTPAEAAAVLDEQFDVAVRAGLHCAPYAHRHLGTFPQGTVRLSVGILTTQDDVRRAAAAFDELAAANAA
ncbi:MAG TPA: aminotransferase class V-fold PLP-dependent enzyme [Candidatus Polarisedimenticolia bacterium]|nr:aminotransferase class V-fold PLP-dependent enzyme [Candidatus Polarisedimenticolia bacterium]